MKQSQSRRREGALSEYEIPTLDYAEHAIVRSKLIGVARSDDCVRIRVRLRPLPTRHPVKHQQLAIAALVALFPLGCLAVYKLGGFRWMLHMVLLFAALHAILFAGAWALRVTNELGRITLEIRKDTLRFGRFTIPRADIADVRVAKAGLHIRRLCDEDPVQAMRALNAALLHLDREDLELLAMLLRRELDSQSSG